MVLPALVERNLSATFYVATRHVDEGVPFPANGRPVSWSGLADIASTGLATIGSHTHDSPRARRVARPRKRPYEIDRSIGLIEDRLGRRCRHFAYPKAIAPSAAAEVVVRRRFSTAALAGNRPNIAGARRPAPARPPRGHDIRRRRSFARKVAGGAAARGLAPRARRDAWWARRSTRRRRAAAT